MEVAVIREAPSRVEGERELCTGTHITAVPQRYIAGGGMRAAPVVRPRDVVLVIEDQEHSIAFAMVRLADAVAVIRLVAGVHDEGQ